MRADHDARAAAADQAANPEAWHGLAWLSEQYPLVEGRLQDVGARLASTAGNIVALQALVQRIEDDKVGCVCLGNGA